MVSAIPVVTVRPDIAGLATTFLTSGRLCSRPVHRTCVVCVDQLTSRVTDTNRSRSDDEGSQHSAQSQDVNDRRFAEYKDEDGQNQCQAGRPHELLGIFLVPLERGIRHDTLDPILLTLAGVHRHDGASEDTAWSATIETQARRPVRPFHRAHAKPTAKAGITKARPSGRCTIAGCSGKDVTAFSCRLCVSDAFT